ncbi:MAG TPA: hypothetical protein VM576_01925 [Xanthomonadaceae bacterium]|nr:hypothetical protein [Xanthomonadaceae bacterium]
MTPTPDQVRRNRRLLLLIVALFLGSMLVAGALRFSGWRPANTKNHGELLDPPGDLRALTPRLEDGAEYRWEPVARRWRIAVAPPAECGDACATVADQVDLVWQLLGRNADHVDVLWLCPDAGDCMVPGRLAREPALRRVRFDAALRAGLPRNTIDPASLERGLPVYVIDPNGFVILRYAPGFDPAGLRQDLGKLLRLM